MSPKKNRKKYPEKDAELSMKKNQKKNKDNANSKKGDDKSKKKKKKQKNNKVSDFYKPLKPHPDEQQYLVVSRNAYLEGKPFELPPHKYGINFMDDTDSTREREKNWALQRAKYGFDERETWNLDIMFVEWLYSHIRMFKEIAPLPVEFPSYEMNGNKLTQSEAMEFILDACEFFILHHDEIATDDADQAYDRMSDAIKLWGELFGAMWW